MAADTRPYKSKEQDGQGNELIIRDQQLVEQDTTTTMPAGTCFQTLDVDGRPVKIPKANMVDIVREALGTLLNGLSDQTTVTKVPSLNGNTLGASTVATLASVLGAFGMINDYGFVTNENANTYKVTENCIVIFDGTSCTNLPTSDEYAYIVLNIYSKVGGSERHAGFQMAFKWGGTKLYIRCHENATWELWRQVTVS